MAATAELIRHTPEALSNDDRDLADVDHLIEHRYFDGTYPEYALTAVFQNKTSATQEAAMPYAVTTVEHEESQLDDERPREVTYMWLGQTAVATAMSGYKFHRHPAALKRVDVEVDEARFKLQPGSVKAFISPRMSAKDAPAEVAKDEHLFHDDAVRTSRLEIAANGRRKRIIQSLLVRDVPLDAWQAMLNDPENVFGKTIPLDDPESALSVMKTHRELETAPEQLPEGPVSLVEAVVPYIQEPHIKQKVLRQLELFRGDQEEMRAQAERIAERWLHFDVELAESLVEGLASFEIQRFIVGLQHHWGDEDLAIIRDHQLDGAEYLMTRELAAVLERAKQNTLWTAAAVVTNNEYVIEQMDPRAVQELRQLEANIQMAQEQGMSYAAIEAGAMRLVASQNVKVGGGCPGMNETQFKNGTELPTKPEGLPELTESENMDRKEWTWKSGVCRVPGCPTRPSKTQVGPCEVCRTCQHLYDQGKNPIDEYKLRRAKASQN